MPAAAADRRYATADRDRAPAAVLRAIAKWRPPILGQRGPAPLTPQPPMPAHPHRAPQPPMPAHLVARRALQLHAAAVVVDMPVPAAHHAAAVDMRAAADASNLQLLHRAAGLCNAAERTGSAALHLRVHLDQRALRRPDSRLYIRMINARTSRRWIRPPPT